MLQASPDQLEKANELLRSRILEGPAFYNGKGAWQLSPSLHMVLWSQLGCSPYYCTQGRIPDLSRARSLSSSTPEMPSPRKGDCQSAVIRSHWIASTCACRYLDAKQVVVQHAPCLRA